MPEIGRSDGLYSLGREKIVHMNVFVRNVVLKEETTKSGIQEGRVKEENYLYNLGTRKGRGNTYRPSYSKLIQKGHPFNGRLLNTKCVVLTPGSF